MPSLGSTGGNERLDLPGVWDTLVAQPQFINIAVWLIIAGLLAFLLRFSNVAPVCWRLPVVPG